MADIEKKLQKLPVMVVKESEKRSSTYQMYGCQQEQDAN